VDGTAPRLPTRGRRRRPRQPDARRERDRRRTARAGGVATGINNTFRQVGIAVGVAVLGAIFQGRVESNLDQTLVNGPAALRPIAADLAGRIASGNPQSAFARTPDGTQEFLVTAGRGAFVNGLNEILLVAAVVALAGSALSFLLVRRRDFVHEVDDTVVEEQALELAA
jgi:hypothetical protein